MDIYTYATFKKGCYNTNSQIARVFEFSNNNFAFIVHSQF